MVVYIYIYMCNTYCEWEFAQIALDDLNSRSPACVRACPGMCAKNRIVYLDRTARANGWTGGRARRHFVLSGTVHAAVVAPVVFAVDRFKSLLHTRIRERAVPAAVCISLPLWAPASRRCTYSGSIYYVLHLATYNLWVIYGLLCERARVRFVSFLLVRDCVCVCARALESVCGLLCHPR